MQKNLEGSGGMWTSTKKLPWSNEKLGATFACVVNIQRVCRGGGYKYHGTQMKSLQLTQVPEVQDISNELEQFFKLKWNIGVHMIVYHDGMA